MLTLMMASIAGSVVATRTGEAGAYVYRFEFTGALGAQNIQTLKLEFSAELGVLYDLDIIQEGGSDPVDEVQTVTLEGNPTGGTFTLTFEGQTTGNIAYNASAVTVLAALVALSNLESGDVTVTGDAGGPYTVTFALGRDVSEMTASGAGLTGGGVYVSTVQAAVAGVDEQQRIVFGVVAPTGGTFTLGYGAETTAAIAYNASAATVKSELEALSITTVTVTLNADGWTVEFDNPGQQDVVLLTINEASLTFPAVASVAVDQTFVRGNSIVWGLQVDGDLEPLGELLPGDPPSLFRILPTTVIGFRGSVHDQRVQVIVLER